MSKSLIQVTNQSTQAVTDNSIITLGSVQRRFGCNCKLSGNGIELVGEGYYTVEAPITVAPTAEGNVTVALYNNGTPLTGAIASFTAIGAGDFVTLPIIATIRQGCCCANADTLTLVLTEGTGSVTNVSIRVEKV